MQMGQYSLDIFIWHMLVRAFLFANPNMIANIWVKRIYAYAGMFFIPIIIRKICEDIKSAVKDEMVKLKN